MMHTRHFSNITNINIMLWAFGGRFLSILDIRAISIKCCFEPFSCLAKQTLSRKRGTVLRQSVGSLFSRPFSVFFKYFEDAIYVGCNRYLIL